MKDAEYNRRQRAAYFRLKKAGLLRQAQKWIGKNRPPQEWEGTPLEYAELEMPVSFWKSGTWKRIKALFQ